MRTRASTTGMPDPKVGRHVQGAYAVGVRVTLLPQALQFPVQAPVVFLLRRRDARNGPYPVLARVITHKHREQLVAVKAVRLRATGAPVHLDTGRIHHEIGNTLLS